MLDRHFPWVRAVVTIAAMTARRIADLTIRASDGRVRATVYRPTIARAIVFGLGLVGLLFPAARAAGDTPGHLRHVRRRSYRPRRSVPRSTSAIWPRGGPGLAVTEASSTGVIESFSLLTLEGLRVVPADGGVYFAICPRHARCPLPARRSARPAAAFLPRRQALELALRTFLETPADVVAVSLPTTRFVLFIVERGELEREVDLPTLTKRLAGNPTLAVDASLRRSVDQLTYSRIFIPLGLESTATGADTMPAVALWPTR